MARGINLVLGGGGARGFAHVGVIKTLLADGIRIDEAAGTSMGAVMAAYYALHGDVAAPEALAKSMTRASMLFYFDPTIPRHSLIGGARVHGILKEWFGDARIEDAKIPLTIVATDLQDGRAILFRKGPIVEALRASCAIPGILPAVKIGERYYVDGGVADLVPIDAVSRRRRTVAVALPIAPTHQRIAEPPDIGDVLARCMSLTAKHGTGHFKVDGVLLVPLTGAVHDTLRFHRSHEFLKNGEAAAKKALPRIRKLLL